MSREEEIARIARVLRDSGMEHWSWRCQYPDKGEKPCDLSDEAEALYDAGLRTSGSLDEAWQALADLEAKATPGPWHQYAVTGEYIKNASNGTVADLRYKMGAADAAFIVAAVNFVRANLAQRLTEGEKG